MSMCPANIRTGRHSTSTTTTKPLANQCPSGLRTRFCYYYSHRPAPSAGASAPTTTTTTQSRSSASSSSACDYVRLSGQAGQSDRTRTIVRRRVVLFGEHVDENVDDAGAAAHTKYASTHVRRIENTRYSAHARTAVAAAHT